MAIFFSGFDSFQIIYVDMLALSSNGPGFVATFPVVFNCILFSQVTS